MNIHSLRNKLFFLLLLFSQVKNIAQTNDRFSHLDVEKGLLSDQSFSIAEDSLGYIWIGTLGGIQRYDGYEMINYKFSSESQIYNASFVRDIKLQGSDTIWFADRGNGVGCIIKGKLKKPLLSDDGLSSNHAECLLVDAKKGLWVGTIDSGLNYIKDGKISIFRHDPNRPTSLSSNEVYSLMEDNKGNIWVGTTKGINLYLGNGIFKHFSHDPIDKKTLSHNFVHALHQDIQGTIWAGTVDGGLNKFVAKDSSFQSYKTDKIDPYSISANVVLTIEDAVDGGLWVGTWGGGLDYFDGEKFFSNRHDPQNKSTISSNYIEDIMTDSNGDIWIASYQGGVNKYTKQQFTTYRSNDIESSGMIQSTITSLYESNNGDLWIATNNGINKFKGKSSEKFTPPKLELVSNDIHKIFEDSKGRLWIGMIGLGRGVQMVDDGHAEHFYNVDNDTTSLSNDFIECIFEDSKNKIWVGTRNGLNLYEKGKFKRFTSPTNDINIEGLPNNQIRGICEGKDDGIWIATYGGGLSFLKDGEFTNYLHDSQDLNSLPSNNLWDVERDNKGNLWIATRTNIINFNLELNKFISYGKGDGINNTIIEDLVIDNNNNIWVATHDGLLRFDANTNHFERFTKNDGLAGNHINTIFNGKKQIYIGGIGGFATIEKDSVLQKKKKGKLRYSRLEILTNNYKKIDSDLSEFEMIANQHITLPYNINNFIIYFTILNQDIEPNHQYQYRVENLTDEWIYNGKSNKISFVGIPPGDYVLQVKSQNKDEVITIPINILPPFWKTHVAYVLYIIILGSIFYFLYSSRVKKRKLGFQLQFSEHSRIKDNELNRTKMKFFTNVSHELRTPLTLIMAPLQDLMDEKLSKKVKKNLDFINQNSRKLLQLTNQLLDFRKITNEQIKLHASKQDLVLFAKNSVSLFNNKANKEKIKLKFSSSLIEAMVFFDGYKMEAIIANLLSNAFKFQNGEIAFELKHIGDPMINVVMDESRLVQNYIEILVSDNGKGIDQEEIQFIFNRFYQNEIQSFDTIGSGIGLALTKDLVEMHYGTLSVTSISNKKTSFSVKLPFGSAHLSNSEIVNKDAVLNENSQNIINVQNKHPNKIRVKRLNKILLVEDNVDLSEYLSSTLSEFYSIVCAKNGKEGLAHCATNDFNLIISDVMMDEMGGIEFCKRVKSNPDTDYIPIILLTAKSLEENELEGLMAGANDYITKPFNIKILCFKIDNLLRLQRSLNKLYNNILIDKEISYESDSLPQRDFLKNTLVVIESNLGSQKFGVNELASKLNMSRSSLYKKIKFLTGKPIVEVIMEIRLKKALSLLCNSNERISEIAYKTGFNDPKYFRVCFKTRFGDAPKIYREKFSKKSSLPENKM